MDRKKGTSGEDRPSNEDAAVVATYREFAPSPGLQAHVRAFFTFSPGLPARHPVRALVREARFRHRDSFCSALFADGQASLAIDLGAVCELGSGWTAGTRVGGRALGPTRRVGGKAGSACAEMVGAYLQPGAVLPVLAAPAAELTDRFEDLDGLWGADAVRLAEDLAELSEAKRVDRLEKAILQRLRRTAAPAKAGIDVVGLARRIQARPAAMSVRGLAEASGVSRQHLTRVFREVIGITPKRYCRLARFHRGLAYAGAGSGVPWAKVAVGLGYADQSHMIAEFRELSSLTPESLATQNWFHPFILEARARTPREH